MFVQLDYVRVWSVARRFEQQQADVPLYDTHMHYGVEFLALLDEGRERTPHARTAHNDTVQVAQGEMDYWLFKDGSIQWMHSDIPTTKVGFFL